MEEAGANEVLLYSRGGLKKNPLRWCDSAPDLMKLKRVKNQALVSRPTRPFKGGIGLIGMEMRRECAESRKSSGYGQTTSVAHGMRENLIVGVMKIRGPTAY